MAQNTDFTQEKHTFSGPTDQWIDFEMPGMCMFTCMCASTYTYVTQCVCVYNCTNWVVYKMLRTIY